MGFFRTDPGSIRETDPIKVEGLLDRIQDALSDSRSTSHRQLLETLSGIWNYVEVNREFTRRQEETVDRILGMLQRGDE